MTGEAEASVQNVGGNMSGNELEIFYRCCCGFRTFFSDEVEVHLAEVAKDHHRHEIKSVMVERGGT